MSDTLFWHNSEVLQITPPDENRQVRITLAAAAVERAGVLGFLHPLELVFTQARVTGEVSACLGSIAQGTLQTASGSSREIALPWVSEEQVQLELQFHNGSHLLIEADSACCMPSAEARFNESYAC